VMTSPPPDIGDPESPLPTGSQQPTFSTSGMMPSMSIVPQAHRPATAHSVCVHMGDDEPAAGAHRLQAGGGDLSVGVAERWIQGARLSALAQHAVPVLLHGLAIPCSMPNCLLPLPGAGPRLGAPLAASTAQAMTPPCARTAPRSAPKRSSPMRAACARVGVGGPRRAGGGQMLSRVFMILGRSTPLMVSFICPFCGTQRMVGKTMEQVGP
jgi:hypothetical protein